MAFEQPCNAMLCCEPLRVRPDNEEQKAARVAYNYLEGRQPAKLCRHKRKLHQLGCRSACITDSESLPVRNRTRVNVRKRDSRQDLLKACTLMAPSV